MARPKPETAPRAFACGHAGDFCPCPKVETWYQWARRLFEFENCGECGKGVRGHTPARGPFGEWRAICKGSK